MTEYSIDSGSVFLHASGIIAGKFKEEKCMTNRSLCFNRRQKATVLAALRYWQGRKGPHLIEFAIATDGGEFEMLTAAEIDSLCEEINSVECEADEEAPRWLPMGEAIHGTGRMDDLFPAVLGFAEANAGLFDPATNDMLSVARAYWSWGNHNDEESCSIYNDICDALNGVCPPFCYFGSNEGDDSSIGVWVCDEAIHDAIHLEDSMGKLIINEGAPDTMDFYASQRRDIIVVDDNGGYRQLWIWDDELEEHELAWEIK